jgi:hypothetical protein
MPKHEYNGLTYEIGDLKKNKRGILTKQSQRVLKSYQKAISKPITCKGFLNQSCGKPAQPGNQGRCGSCYNKEYHLRSTNDFISQITGINDIQISSLNPNIYSNTLCTENGCSSKTGISYPYCQVCLSSIHHLRVELSNIPECGLGLFADGLLSKGHRFSITYGSSVLNADEFAILEAQTDPVSKFKYSYLIQIKNDMFIDGSDEQGGVLRFLNNSLSQKLTNCEFYCYKGEIKVRTTKDIQSGCELFLIYNHKNKFPFKPSVPKDALKQQIEILECLNSQ